MARFLTIAVLASLLLALIANASSYRTTITTVEFDEQSSRSRSGGCQEQIRREDLSSCEQYVSQISRPRLALRGIHNRQGDQEQVQQCCQQIRRVDRQCQCDALRSVIEEQTQHQRRPEQEETQEVQRRATDIQRQCSLPDCQSQSIWF
ncbi:2S seed storage albumin protein-like [Populus nigra]|uniref:2S seed storage albumin protein-like n=1 Tax=Populus nigra TaxID=3691 RepID=UPI002B26AFA0|nr:2S seed storage albumin protein-like [Populus nigra]